MFHLLEEVGESFFITSLRGFRPLFFRLIKYMADSSRFKTFGLDLLNQLFVIAMVTVVSINEMIPANSAILGNTSLKSFDDRRKAPARKVTIVELMVTKNAQWL